MPARTSISVAARRADTAVVAAIAAHGVRRGGGSPAETGVVPVTRASGKSRSVAFRFAANRRARLALTTFADNSRHSSDWAAKIYNDARARQKRHPHAVRILARAWLRVMRACRRDGSCYDPVTHRANNKINNPAEAALAA